MDDTTLIYKRMERLQLKVDTLTAELDRVTALCVKNGDDAEQYKRKLSEAIELLSVAECGPCAYVDIQKRGEWRTKRDSLVK